MEKECYFYLGKQYPLEIVHHNTEPLTFDQRFCLLSHYYDKKEPLIKQWYKQQALRYFQQRTHELAEQFGKAGQQLAAISAAIGAGKCTRAEAAKIVLSNPEIAQAAFTAASRGIITLSL